MQKKTKRLILLLLLLILLAGAVWVLLFYGEKPGAFALAGGAVVIVTITVWSIHGERKSLKESP